MTHSPARGLVSAYQQVHERALRLTESLSDAELNWQPFPTSHTVAFHLWHLARWADHVQAALPGMTPDLARLLGMRPQHWESERLAEAWGWSAIDLGNADTGMQMSDDLARTLPFPEGAALLEYARRTFEAANQAVEVIDDTLAVAPEQPQPLTEGFFGGGTVGSAILATLG
jgi:hypothetical protein